jgi:hypothetical protein
MNTTFYKDKWGQHGVRVYEDGMLIDVLYPYPTYSTALGALAREYPGAVKPPEDRDEETKEGPLHEV